MATIVVRAVKPVEGEALANLATATPLSESEAATLYSRALGDVTATVSESGADLLITHPDAEASVREVVEPVLEDPNAARFERQVGSTADAQLGNTVTHLLEDEAAASVGVLDSTAVLVTRSHLDQAAMTLRRHDVLVGPATDGELHYAGFAEPIDFTDVFQPPVVETLVERATESGLSTDVLDPSPTLRTRQGLRSALPILRARQRAGLAVPERTVGYLEEVGIRVGPGKDEDEVEIQRE